jgi:deoxyribonuclease IV
LVLTNHKIESLRFGTAGIPISTQDRSTVNGISEVKKLGLASMELEFVRSVNITKEKAPEVRLASIEHDIVLTCHAPYFINLNSTDKAKWHASIQRIVQSAKIASLCNGWSVCFHPAYYMGDSSEIAYKRVKDAIDLIVNELKKDGIDIWIRPEIGGKGTQFGSPEELLELSNEFENVLPCIDWSHLHARTNGKYNTRDEYTLLLEQMEKKLGKRALQNVHFHCQGISYGEKGEKSHIPLKESDMNYQELIKVWKEFKLKGVVISESPNIEQDALLMKKTYEKA